jgi:2-polyprenyl-3-methyl-5-hydroxy-6-metoxy-1,4-benzoquinol methylase
MQTTPKTNPITTQHSDGVDQSTPGGEPWTNLSGLTAEDLVELQWINEPKFARAICDAPKGSAERAQVTAQAYDTITAILQHQQGASSGHVSMGYNPRYLRLVEQLVRGRQKPRVFEIGYGSGALLAAMHEQGIEIAGIEVSGAMHRQACEHLPAECRSRLLVGDFLSHDFGTDAGTYDLVFWNDVFEHIVPDEIADYLTKIYSLLKPGGRLVTITPNWHTRPSDVTADHCPPRTEAIGFHLKEYTLREVTQLLRRAGFASVGTPLFVTSGQMCLCGNGLAALKRVVEPMLEWLPFPAARLLCRGLGLTCTIARKQG